MLQAWEAGNRTSGDAKCSNDFEEAEFEAAAATSHGATAQSISAFPGTAGTGSGRPQDKSNLLAFTMPRPAAIGPECGLNARIVRVRAPIQATGNGTRKPVRSQSSAGVRAAQDTAGTTGSTQGRAAQKPGAALQTAAGSGATPVGNVPPTVSVSALAVIQAPPEPIGSSAPPETRHETGSSGRAQLGEQGTAEAEGIPSAADIVTASHSEPARWAVTANTAGTVRAANAAPLSADGTAMTAMRSEPRDDRMRGALDAALSPPAVENASSGFARATKPLESNGPQHPPQSAPAVNGQGTGTQTTHVEAAGSAAPDQVETGHSGLAELPAAADANGLSLESTRQATSVAHNAAAPAAKAGAANTSVNRNSAVQTVGPGAGTAGWVQVPESSQGGVSPIPGVAASSNRTALTAAKETFAELDGGTAVGTPAWVHSGGHQAEAGFQDPALGWVGVRADLSGGSVHAALVPSSAEAGQVLGAHMAGLSAYLSEQRAPVASLSLVGADGSGPGSGQPMQQGAGQSAGGGEAFESHSRSQSSLPAAPSREAGRSTNEGGGSEESSPARGSRGRHISVVA